MARWSSGPSLLLFGLLQSSRPGDAPGQDMDLKEKALGAVEGLVQNFTPVKQIHQHVCGFHGYAHDMSRQACPRQAVCSSGTQPMTIISKQARLGPGKIYNLEGKKSCAPIEKDEKACVRR